MLTPPYSWNVQGDLEVNKKLFAMMMVPVVVVMGGTFAFSAWSGSANAFFGQSSATVSYTETLTFQHTDAHYTNLSLTGTQPGIDKQAINHLSGPELVSESTGSATGVAAVYANVSNMLPGDYVNFTVTITNEGSATLNTSMFNWQGGQAYNAAGTPLTNPTPITGLQPPVTSSYLANVVANGIANVPATQTNLWYLFNATTTSSTPGMLAQGQSITYSVYAILSSNAPASAAGTSFYFGVLIPITVDQ